MPSFNKIPLIDLTPLFSNPENGISEIAEQVRHIYTTVGFAYLVNHGISQDLINEAFQASKDFFDLPLEAKLKIQQNKQGRGYVACETSIIKSSTLGAAKKPNQSEGFLVAHEVAPEHPDYVAGINLAGPNQWPDDMPAFQKLMIHYRSSMLQLARKMVQVFSVAFGLKPDGLDHLFIHPSTFLRLQYYPAQPHIIRSEQFGIAPHTDYGFLTLLAQDTCGGLQVKNQDGQWIEAPPLEGSFILNSGDMLKRLSNDVFISTPHRVINTSGKKRYSIPFFLEPDMHASIAPLPPFYDTENPPKYPPLHYYEHIMERVKSNYSF